MQSNPQAEQRRVLAWAAAGMVAVFVTIAVLVRMSGQPWSTAAAVAGLPTVFGGAYFGALLPLSRRDHSDDSSAAPAVAASPSTTTLPSDDESVERRDGDSEVVAPAA